MAAAALAAADPGNAVRAHLDPRLLARDRVFLVALGKASIGMTAAALDLAANRLVAGVVAHPHGLAPPDWSSAIRAIAAGHPYPDAGSLAAGAEAWRMLGDVRRGDLVLVLVSGGGSAMFEHLRPGVTLEDLAALTKALQLAGADIHDLNTVRRSLSLVKGGGLARRAGAADVLALLLSDVMSDDPTVIASGPTVPSPTEPADALEVLGEWKLTDEFPAIVDALRAAPRQEATPDTDTRIIGSNHMAIEAAAACAKRLGFHPAVMRPAIEGEAHFVGGQIGAMAVSYRRVVPDDMPACMLLGGETTVTVQGDGRGGRNLELALGIAKVIESVPHIAALSFATDGVDGSSDAAGAFVTGMTIDRAKDLGLDYRDTKIRNDTAPYFEALGDAYTTGPTGTNVNDLVFVVLYP